MIVLSSLIPGLVGGLLATLLVVALKNFWVKVVEPWYEEKVYQDAHIEGRWKSQYTLDGSVREGTIELKRKAHAVSGTITLLTGPNKGKSFQFQGAFRNLIMTASYASTDKNALDRGTLTLMLVGNGRRLDGFMVAVHSVKLALHDFLKSVTHWEWTMLSGSGKTFGKGGSVLIGWWSWS